MASSANSVYNYYGVSVAANQPGPPQIDLGTSYGVALQWVIRVRVMFRVTDKVTVSVVGAMVKS